MVRTVKEATVKNLFQFCSVFLRSLSVFPHISQTKRLSFDFDICLQVVNGCTL